MKPGMDEKSLEMATFRYCKRTYLALSYSMFACLMCVFVLSKYNVFFKYYIITIARLLCLKTF